MSYRDISDAPDAIRRRMRRVHRQIRERDQRARLAGVREVPGLRIGYVGHLLEHDDPDVSDALDYYGTLADGIEQAMAEQRRIMDGLREYEGMIDLIDHARGMP